MMSSTFILRSLRTGSSRGLTRQYQSLCRRPLRRPTLPKSHQDVTARRWASSVATEVQSTANYLRNVIIGSSLGLAIVLGYFYVTDTRASIHRYVVVPMIRFVWPDAEDAHHFGNNALRLLWQFGLHPRERDDSDAAGDLSISVFGHTLVNPIATSGGLDKDASLPNPLFALGPAIVEVGGTTPLPQEGNPKPRVFRIPSQNALINRYGLNSLGADHMAVVLRYRVRDYARSIGLGYDADAEKRILHGEAGVPPGSLMPGRLMAVQIAKNKTTPETDVEAVKADYVYCVDRLGKYADILVVNVSSPNTPGLRSLQASGPLTEILKSVVDAAKQVDRKTKPAVMVKVSPDEDSDQQIAGICEAVWASGVDGVIVGNTTKKRPATLPAGYRLGPKEEEIMMEQGGYSGPQLFEKTVALVKRYRSLLDTRPQSLDEGKAQTSSSETRAEQIKNNPSQGKSLTVQGTAQEGTPVEKAKDSIEKIAETTETETIPLRDISDLPSSEKQPLIQLPERHRSDHTDGAEGSPASAPPSTYLTDPPTSETAPNPSVPNAVDPPKTATETPLGSSQSNTPAPASIPKNEPPKVIFATGGITNGKQALEVLNAGASVAMVYTALVYGGAGTISRIKNEMRDEMKKSSKAKTI